MAVLNVATNYGTGGSQVTILFALGKIHVEAAVRYTYAVAVKTKVILFSLLDIREFASTVHFCCRVELKNT